MELMAEYWIVIDSSSSGWSCCVREVDVLLSSTSSSCPRLSDVGVRLCTFIRVRRKQIIIIDNDMITTFHNSLMTIVFVCFVREWIGVGSLGCLSFLPNTNSLFSSSTDRSIHHYSLDALGYIETLYGHQSSITDMDVSTHPCCPITVSQDRMGMGMCGR